MFTSEEKAMLLKQRDGSKEAVTYRLKLARKAAGVMPVQLARESGVTIQTYSNQENGVVYPSRQVMRTLYRSYGIDYNFLFEGDFNHLSPDTQARLFQAAADEASPEGPTAG